MRAPLLAAVLLAGCLGFPAPDDPPPQRLDRVALDGCARLLVLPEAASLRAYHPLRIDLALENCSDGNLVVTDEDVCDYTHLNVTLERGDEAFVLRAQSISPGGTAKHVCGDLVGVGREVPAGAWLNESATWNGTRVDRIQPCPTPCDARLGARPAEPGEYRIVATAITPEGVVQGEARVRLDPPAVPPADPRADVRFVLNASYRVGDVVPVVVENVGDRPYRYRILYAACDLEYYTDDGRPFRVPPGTHCDIANADAVQPGATALLFNWSLDECTLDQWGCLRGEPLPPGTYHLRGRFHPAEGEWWRDPEDHTYAGATIRIEP